MHWLRKNGGVCETGDPHTAGSKDPGAPGIYTLGLSQCRAARVRASLPLSDEPTVRAVFRVLVDVPAIWRRQRSPAHTLAHVARVEPA